VFEQLLALFWNKFELPFGIPFGTDFGSVWGPVSGTDFSSKGYPKVLRNRSQNCSQEPFWDRFRGPDVGQGHRAKYECGFVFE
jgi:hypothetical protein